MRATVRARKARAGVVATKLGALAFSLGVVTLAGAFFTGPALAEGAQAPRGFVTNHEDGHEEPPPCGEDPLPPCQTTLPPPPVTTGPPAPTTNPPKPSNPPTSHIKDPKPTKTTGGGGGGPAQPGGGQGPVDNGPQLPATGSEVSLLAGAGAALVGGGAALVLVARRRRAAALASESVSGSEES